jgi:hypothetical protein
MTKPLEPRPNTWREFEHHSIANIWPLMEDNEFDALKEDINKTGKLLYPIVLFENKILDGRNRYNACRDVAVKPDFVELPAGTDPIAYVLSANEQRRHMSQSQRALVAAKLASLKLGDNQHSGEGLSIEKASQLLNISPASVSRCKNVLSTGVPELVQMVEKDKLAASAAEKVAKLPKDKQTELVKKGANAVRKSAKEEKEKKEKKEETPPAKSDEVDALGDRLIEALKKLEKENAEAAVSELIRRFKDADLYDPNEGERRKKKAA